MVDIEVRVLGRPHLSIDGSVVPLGGRQVIVALRLALARRSPVSTARLRDDVWPEGTGSEGALRVMLTRLRAVLGPDAVVRTSQGYALREDIRLDADRFEALVAASTDRDYSIDRRLTALDEGLGLWTGSAFDGIEPTSWINAEAVRLNELREQAIDDRFELRLLVEDPRRIVADLRVAVDDRPLRETRAELLATALYRAGRQVDALQVVDRHRTDLREQLGLSPGPALDALEVRILQHDRTLLHSTPATRAAQRAEAESQLRAASALMKAGAFHDASTIVDSVAAETIANGDRHAYAQVLLAKAQGSVLAGTGDPHPLIDEAISIGRELRDGPLLARCAHVRFGSGVPNDRIRALVELTEPLELLPMTAPQRIDLLCAAAVIVTFIDGSETADLLLETAQRTFDRVGSRRAEAVSLATRAIVGAVRKVDMDRVDEWASRSYQIAQELDDPTVTVVTIMALLRTRYMRGDLAGIDGVLDQLERESRDAVLPFGTVRVALCRITNAIARGELDDVPSLLAHARAEGLRLRTFAVAGATFGQQNLLHRELGTLAETVPQIRLFAGKTPTTVWDAVLALAGEGDANDLLALVDNVPADDVHLAFAAIAAEVASRDRSAALGAWCAPLLDAHGDLAVTVGLGSVVMGFAAHFAGHAHLALGDSDGAAVRFDRARCLARDAGADLWAACSSLSLAEILADSSDRVDVARAAELVAEVEPIAAKSGSVRVRKALDELNATLSTTAPGGS